MQHVRQLQIALSVLLAALVLLIICGAVLIFAYKPGAQTAVVTSNENVAQRAEDPGAEAAAPALDAVAQQGQTIFNNNCTVCHSLGSEVVVGPGLKGVTQRRPEAWLTSWIRNSQKMVQSGDAYAVEIYNKFNKTAMPPYDFSDEEMKSLLTYIEVAGK